MKSKGPIIQSLLDTDLYTFTMMQVVYHQYPHVEVEYRFRCRTKGVNLIPYMGEIEEEIAAYCDLRFNEQELDILGRKSFIKKDFVEFLEIYRPRMKHVKVVRSDSESGEIDIIVTGPWLFTIPFEQPVLAIVQEVYWRNNCDMNEAYARGKQILINKVKAAQKHPKFDDFRFSDFGTRRRFSREWHEKVVALTRDLMPLQLNGSSNVLLADRYHLICQGTMAHQFIMAHQQIGPRLRDSQTAAFSSWMKEYEGQLGYALTDTIGMRQFCEDFNLLYSKAYDGMRHDSADPKHWADQAIEHYKSMRIDPMTKNLIFSDGLDFEKALGIMDYIEGRANGAFGIGTSLTNDVGVTPLNNVMKMTMCQGQPVAKISDAPGKSMCMNKQFEAYLAEVYKADHYQPA
jgi:nicotinate phosphoribosyltransferase